MPDSYPNPFNGDSNPPFNQPGVNDQGTPLNPPASVNVGTHTLVTGITPVDAGAAPSAEKGNLTIGGFDMKWWMWLIIGLIVGHFVWKG